MDANKTLIKTATNLLKPPSKTLISVLLAKISGFNCGKTMEGQNDTKYDSKSFCPPIVLPIPQHLCVPASPATLRQLLSNTQSNQSREGL
ncbi:hypothetical protein LF1_23400 [Rubripirellula obstinata]|uniref:Uncharacterized protein n=1 Tax=Rubripirellula obstinata TaxID=406547 RepID=A0A5B1CK73_9BACT|nr:hypothetical protein LF1_23400 [Rubripirellula obstinata]